MAKKVKKSQLADDILLSLNEALKYARGEKADVVVHRVIPSARNARAARRILGIETKPKAVRSSAR
ncbi:MAG TPA: hypothetical protein VFA53_06035 [Xanthobacteraceae bacterium]|nr:hypothetical protein [Xanthobacteraceae bacterium]